MRYREQLGLLVDELESNDRLRYGSILILCIALLWVVLVLSDMNTQLQRDYFALKDRQLELSSLGDLPLWEQRYQSQVVRKEMLETRLWQMQSESQTIAAIQSTLRLLASNAGFIDTNIKVGSPQPLADSPGISMIRFRVRGNYADDQALGLIALIDDFEPALSFENLSLEVIDSRGVAKNRLNADIVAYYRSNVSTVF